MALLLQRLATLAFRRRRTFVAAWLVAIVVTLGSYAAFGSRINSDFTSSTKASKELAHRDGAEMRIGLV